MAGAIFLWPVMSNLCFLKILTFPVITSVNQLLPPQAVEAITISAPPSKAKASQIELKVGNPAVQQTGISSLLAWVPDIVYKCSQKLSTSCQEALSRPSVTQTPANNYNYYKAKGVETGVVVLFLTTMMSEGLILVTLLMYKICCLQTASTMGLSYSSKFVITTASLSSLGCPLMTLKLLCNKLVILQKVSSKGSAPFSPMQK
ncbi:hypothetical protein PPERSA_01161 [Pseudocohnilembus persalinus]|uniref:Uncharacterized protein n=1 Tax=Pseudocohnilembus persalinus TaxID=266149 RepID=A0A0V0R130_PSEPJ|nr:hypothetical protein PPERSA_01161 [Pseudocohnilembus persalinus]|eukprot:KRX08231.1 hypothetical protein PPERSA_01161 [Pseudocohnilembus persalinus]